MDLTVTSQCPCKLKKIDIISRSINVSIIDLISLWFQFKAHHTRRVVKGQKEVEDCRSTTSYNGTTTVWI